MTESLTSNLSAELRNPAYNDESDGHVRLRAAEAIDRLTAERDRLREALVMSVNAMREPLDGWKGEVEAIALVAARAALGDRT
jgi:hypothetical protein